MCIFVAFRKQNSVHFVNIKSHQTIIKIELLSINFFVLLCNPKC